MAAPFEVGHDLPLIGKMPFAFNDVALGLGKVLYEHFLVHGSRYLSGRYVTLCCVLASTAIKEYPPLLRPSVELEAIQSNSK